MIRAGLDHCVKCTICETVCPVAAVTPLFPGPKYCGPQGERFRAGEPVDRGLDYCSSCGICTLACPQGVPIAELNSRARAELRAGQIPLRDRLIVQTVLLGRLMTPVAPLANTMLRLRAVRVLLDRVLGIARDAPLPIAQPQSFPAWLRHHRPPDSPRTRGTIVFFHGCAGGYFEARASIHTVEVLEHLGFEVFVPRQGCCGLAQQSNGLFDQARFSVRRLARQLCRGGREPIIVTSAGSCAGMLKHEAHRVLGVDDPAVLDVGARLRDTSEFLMELADAGELPLSFVPLPLRVSYHAPCQVKAQGMGMPALRLLGLIPGLEVIESGQACCGMAGTYGLKTDRFEIAQAVGRPLFDMVLATGAELVACDTETCRWQITRATGVPAVHPISLVHRAYGLAAKEVGQ